MKGTYKIQSGLGNSYELAYIELQLSLFQQIETSNVDLTAFNVAYRKLAKNTLRKFDRFCNVESFHFGDQDQDQDAVALLLDMLPILHLRGSAAFKGKLEQLGCKKSVLDYFIVKKKLDSEIYRLGERLSLSPQIIDIITILAYQISYLKCRFILEYHTGAVHVSPNGRTIIKTKHFGEKIARSIRDKAFSKVFSFNLPEDEKVILNSDLSKKYLTSGNLLAGANTDGSFNVTFLSRLIYMIVRVYTNRDKSDKHLLRSLFPKFNSLYMEKRFLSSKSEWEEAWEKSTHRKPIGDNYNHYMELKVKSLVDYNRISKYMSENATYQNPNPEINLIDPFNVLKNLSVDSNDVADKGDKQEPQ
jgi:hypothetical protein